MKKCFRVSGTTIALSPVEILAIIGLKLNLSEFLTSVVKEARSKNVKNMTSLMREKLILKLLGEIDVTKSKRFY